MSAILPSFGKDIVGDVSVAALKRLCNPFVSVCWPIVRPITVDEVMAAAASGELAPTPCSGVRDCVFGDRNYHVRRAAFLLRAGWDEPIEIDVGDPGRVVGWKIPDGNHRFAAAIVLGHATIRARVGGSAVLARDLGLTNAAAARGTQPAV
jgi:hypothetical protein